MANKEIDWMFSSEEVRRKISSIPISHENVIEYSLQRLKTGNHEVIDLLKNRVDRGSNLDIWRDGMDLQSIWCPENTGGR